MRIAVITDLHANREALEAVLEHTRRLGVDRYALLGDFVGYGADPAWVVDEVMALRDAGAWLVGGNHDAAVVSGARSSMRPEARHVIEWTRSRLSEAQLAFLGSLGMTAEWGDVLFVHANAYNPPGWDYVQGRLEAVRSMSATRCRVTFCGHMHEPRLFHLSGLGKAGEFTPTHGTTVPLLASRQWLVIPGACGQPRDGDPAACYATYDDTRSEVSYWRVPYDHETAAAKIREANLPQELATRLHDGQ